MDPRAVADLARSGLDAKDIQATIVGNNGITEPIGYKIPYFLPNGQPHPDMYRIRLFEPDPAGGKYRQPVGVPPYPYFAPDADWANTLSRNVHYIIEGEKKAAAAWKYLGLTAVGIGGCHNWMGPRGTTVYRTVSPNILEVFPPHSIVEIIFDGDYQRNENVQHGLAELCIALRDAGHRPVVVTLPNTTEKVGLDDWIMAGNTLADFKRLPRHDGSNLWEGRNSLAHRCGLRAKRNADGHVVKIEPNADNAFRVITSHPWFKNHIWFNEFTKQLQYDDKPLEDPQAAYLLSIFQHEVEPGYRASAITEALNRLCITEEFTRNPLREWLDNLEWDGTPRLSTFFENHCNSAMPRDYLQAVGENWFTMLVARVYRPGCKADNMLILEGPQGIGKSRALATLGQEYYRESKVHDIGSKDFLQGLQGAWIYDLNELRALRRSDHTTIKSLLSSEVDTFRLPYGRFNTSFKRTCVIVGTTNESYYLTDDTGARRFWPIRCGYKVEVELIERDRDQLLAEAVHRFKNGGDWWTMPGDLMTEVTGARSVLSPFLGQVMQATEDIQALPRMWTTSSEYGEPKQIYAYVSLDYIYAYMGMDNLAKNPQRDYQISNALRGLGFEPYRVRRKQLTLDPSDDNVRISVFRKLLGPITDFTLTPRPAISRSKLS